MIVAILKTYFSKKKTMITSYSDYNKSRYVLAISVELGNENKKCKTQCFEIKVLQYCHRFNIYLKFLKKTCYSQMKVCQMMFE